MFDDICTIEKIVRSLHPYHFVNVSQKNDVYELSVVKNIKFDIP